MDEHHVLDFTFVDSQVEEFTKLAFVPRIPSGAIKSIAGKALSGAGETVPAMLNPAKWSQATKGRVVGTLGGSAVGAGAGAATAEEGQRGVGAIRGALAGGALGLVGGQLGTGQGQRQVKRFGQRQLHAMTGYAPGLYKKEKGILSAFGRGASADERLEAARKLRLADIPDEKSIGNLREAATALKGGNILDSGEGRKRLFQLQGGMTGYLPERVRRMIAQGGLRRDVAKLQTHEKGLTGAPQYLANLVKNPKDALTTGLLTTGVAGAGLPMALSAPQMAQAVKDRDPEALGASLAENAFYATSGPMPMLGQMIMGGQARNIGSLPGQAYKKLMGQGTGTSQEYKDTLVGRSAINESMR